MGIVTHPWDYLIVSASDGTQAVDYKAQLAIRCELGLLGEVGHVMVVPDLKGQRIGSGGSTILCVLRVLERELADRPSCQRSDLVVWDEVLSQRRILILHAGGDSKRLPAYAACGKSFVPMPVESESAVPVSLFDCVLPNYLSLPANRGQLVVTAGDVFVGFNPVEVRFGAPGITGLGCFASPEAARAHGVYAVGSNGVVRRYLQKPTPAEQLDHQAVDGCGRAILDIGVLSFSPSVVAALLRLCKVSGTRDGRLRWSGPIGEAIEHWGLDVYRELCCAMGSDITFEAYQRAVCSSGSRWEPRQLRQIFEAVSRVDFRVQVLSGCTFLHFGTTRQLIASGSELRRQNRKTPTANTCLSLTNEMADSGQLAGTDAWVEGCRICAPLTLAGENVLIGVDVREPLSLPRRYCLDVVPGRSRTDEPVHFVRCYHIDDQFQLLHGPTATFCGQPIAKWLETVGARAEDVWNSGVNEGDRTVWNARLFPATTEADGYRRWLWMFSPAEATAEARQQWLSADRYSLAEITDLTDHDAFHLRRLRLRNRQIAESLGCCFGRQSGFSAADLRHVLSQTEAPAGLVADLVADARRYSDDSPQPSNREPFVLSRILHSLGTAISGLAGDSDTRLSEVLPGLEQTLAETDRRWIESWGVSLASGPTARLVGERLRTAALGQTRRAILDTGAMLRGPPSNQLRSDEIIWGRAPVRLDLGGGWTDTPPYSLEHGGSVLNAAVNLNGQPPIQVYARVVSESVIRMTSIDQGQQIEIQDVAELLDYRDPAADFGLVKAALAQTGFSPEHDCWPTRTTLPEMLKAFGGGLEITTLAALPKGSGLGTSSIMGSVVLAVLYRTQGRRLTRRDLFHATLCLEQAVTTGGGWQDQVGGLVGNVKLITSDPGLVPDVRIHFVPSTLLDPHANGGQTLLYYTGITRLAKDILQKVVGRYLDRDRIAMATLGQLRRLPGRIADAMSCKDQAEFGRLVAEAWRLNKRLDPASTSDDVEKLLLRVQPYVLGTKLLGAGGGGFLLMVCKSPEAARKLRQLLQAEPPNQRARFFEFDISREGLAVTVC